MLFFHLHTLDRGKDIDDGGGGVAVVVIALLLLMLLVIVLIPLLLLLKNKVRNALFCFRAFAMLLLYAFGCIINSMIVMIVRIRKSSMPLVLPNKADFKHNIPSVFLFFLFSLTIGMDKKKIKRSL
jgi:hypothetical protein